MSEIFLKIINMSISASYIVLAVLLLRLLLKKAPKWITVVLWGIVAVRLVCPFSVESVLSLIPSSEVVSPDITLDCISYVRRLKALKPPVGVFFEMNGYNTLDTISETFLTLLSTVAQGESEAKSEALKWSYRQRFKKGIPVNNMWAIMGYDTDENGKINSKWSDRTKW